MTENEYAKECIIQILGMLTGERTQLQVISEVPRFCGNNHTDLLIIDRKKKEMLQFEFKLNNIWDLLLQCRGTEAQTGIKTIGLLNTFRKTQKREKLEGKFHHWHMLQLCLDKPQDYHGDRLFNILRSQNFWTPYNQSSNGMVYWYGYMGHKDFDIEDAGKANADRLSFYQLYQRAIKNIYRCDIDFDLIYNLLGVYGKPTAKKHHDEAILDLKKGKKCQ